MSTIHPTAVVEPTARLADDVIVGPLSYVGPHVVLGAGCHLRNHVTLTGHTTVGVNNIFYANAVIGEDPQDLKYQGEPTRLEIGDGNSFRENVTVHTGTVPGGSVTRIGHQNHIMVGVHVAHDVRLGDRIIIANNTLIAGHVNIEDGVTIGGAAAMHHFSTVGKYAFIAGMTRITTDVPPFMKFAGYPGRVRGVNTEGLGRRGFSSEEIDALRQAFRRLFGKRSARQHATLGDALESVANNGPLDPNVTYLVEFVRRSLDQGLAGRYLESIRTDHALERGAFYRSDDDAEANES
jgi:UDP-N-acetylglucosamine acyltransferase